MNFDRLRFVAERAELGEEREAIFAVTIPERPGSFREFCALLGNRSVTEFNYRYADPKVAHLFVGVETAGRRATRDLLALLHKHRIEAYDLSDNEMAKLHVRHLVGGHAPAAEHEILYRFEFPERPGALMRFLDSMSAGLEHQPLPLPQPRRRLRPRAGRNAGSAVGQGRIQTFSRPPGLHVRRTNPPIRRIGCSSGASVASRPRPRHFTAARRHFAQCGNLPECCVFRFFAPPRRFRQALCSRQCAWTVADLNTTSAGARSCAPQLLPVGGSVKWPTRSRCRASRSW